MNPNRMAFKLVEVKLEEVASGDIFVLFDGQVGPEDAKTFYRAIESGRIGSNAIGEVNCISTGYLGEFVEKFSEAAQAN